MIEVEVECQGSAELNKTAVRTMVIEYLQTKNIETSHQFQLEGKNVLLVDDHLTISCIWIDVSNIVDITAPLKVDEENTKFYIYRLQKQNMVSETLDDDENVDGESVPCMNHYLLPNKQFRELWDNLIFDDELKEKLLHYAFSALAFAEHKVNAEIITCNRLLLLHGPPGTGKTSLCKALAQKLAITTYDKYKYTHLIEINSHSLFSKWFSESGKLVMRLFTKIREILADEQNLVCVLIDEVESIAFSRGSMSNQEPKDAMRVVNALLTQLDSLKEYTNAFVFATSNISDSIDAAFLDRADIKQFIGNPELLSRITILRNIFAELLRTGILVDKTGGTIDYFPVGRASEGTNGRTLRKLPFLIYAELKKKHPEGPIPVDIFIANMLDFLKKAKSKQKDHIFSAKPSGPFPNQTGTFPNQTALFPNQDGTDWMKFGEIWK